MNRCAVLVSCVVIAHAGGCRSLENFYGKLDDVTLVRDAAYKGDDDPKHRLDLYLPRDASSFPTVVFIHGGYWRAGDRRYFTPATGLYGNVGTALAEHGIATAVASYRLLPAATLPDMLDDVVAAASWTRDAIEAYGGDPTALFLAGHSAGGHLVTLLGAQTDELRARGLDPSILRGVISLSGIFDIEATTRRSKPDLRDEVFLPLFGTDPASQRRASPALGFGPNMLPTYFIVGEVDYPSCSADHALARARLASLEGATAFFAVIEGNTHEDMVLEIGTAHDDVTPKMAAFVHRMR